MCLGYANPQKHTSREVLASASASRQIFSLPANTDERRSLDFFVSCAATRLSGWLEESFWKRTVLQLSQRQPAIRHALIAVSSAYEQAQANTGSSQPTDSASILRHYNKSIHHLCQQNLGTPQSVLIYLSTCLLFTCLEFIRGDSRTAMSHVVSGLNILHTFEKNFDHTPNHLQPDIQIIHDDLAPIFCRLSIFSNIIGEVTPTIHLKSTDVDDFTSFDSLSEARDGLTDLMNDGIRFVWSITPTKYTGIISTAEIIQQVRLELRAAKWWQRFSLTRSKLRDQASSDASQLSNLAEGLAILEAHFYMVQSFMAVLTASNECAWDPLFPEFDKMVSLAGYVISKRNDRCRNHPDEAFTFEAELVSPLYLTALKCRHPRIRRQAIVLMEELCRREGMLDSRRAGRVARAIIKIEEAGMRDEDGVPPAERRIQFFFEPEVPSNVPERPPAHFGSAGSGPYSIAYKTCEGMFLKTNLEETGAGEAVDVQSRSGVRDDESNGYKQFNIAATPYSQRL